MSVKFGGRFKNFRKGRTFLTLMIFGCPNDNLFCLKPPVRNSIDWFY